jgi:Domain of unknown function (DUF4124)
MTIRAPVRRMPDITRRRLRVRVRLRLSRRLPLLAAIGLLVTSAANADVYKCKGPQGQVTYSESPCPGQPSVKMDLRPPVENRDPQPPASPAVATAPTGVSAASAPAAITPSAVAPSSGGYELSYSDRQRIANLEQIERTTSAYDEQRRSAALEIRNIRSGTLARMSAADLAKKDNYWADLGKLDADRRRAAASQLANLFASYQ